MTTNFQGIPATALAEEFGTPQYVYDADQLNEQYTGLRSRLDETVEILYSLKANPNLAICQSMTRLGAGAEVSSLAELVTAQRAGVPADRIFFLGPGKTRLELEACAKGEAGFLIAESFEELDEYDSLVASVRGSAQVLLRVNPQFSVKGAGLTMSGKARQFGIDEAALLASAPAAQRWPHLRVVGIQAYMGTRILREPVIVENTERILDLAERITERLACGLEIVDVGGGLGIAYFEGEDDLDVEVLTGQLNPVVTEFRARRPGVRVLMELGRYLTARAGTYVVRIRYVKESFGERFAIADGGTNHHMAAVGIGSYVKRNFPVTLLNRDAPDDEAPWNISGPLCTPNDLLVKKARLPQLRSGDLIGVTRSGAYGPSASPGLFLSHGFPAEVLVKDGKSQLIRRRDGLADIIGKQIPLEH
ncbi:diaminopimelate decarboxylase [Amycolatopsis sp. NBC_00345]|uniref:diaminopimelate decarboxylase n=1 Tax=Amycolatopsis sp. NBC_00345 TaxID=2975955 RepID=UPI002E27370E